MELEKIYNAIEAILFVSGDGVDIAKFSEIFDIPKKEMEKILNQYVDEYNYNTSGLRIIKYDDLYQLSTRPEYHEYLVRYAGSKRPNNLSNAALEVLSIIAYNQPVTRSTIDKIRGVDSFGPLEKLLDREIIEEVGRLDAPGRPILYGTTKEFLKIFGLKNLFDIPELESIQMSMEEMGQEEVW